MDRVKKLAHWEEARPLPCGRSPADEFLGIKTNLDTVYLTQLRK